MYRSRNRLQSISIGDKNNDKKEKPAAAGQTKLTIFLMVLSTVLTIWVFFDEFFWSPFVDGDNITVSVENGIATLTGAVDTKSDRSMAEANAYEGGASQVINKLQVR